MSGRVFRTRACQGSGLFLLVGMVSMAVSLFPSGAGAATVVPTLVPIPTGIGEAPGNLTCADVLAYLNSNPSVVPGFNESSWNQFDVDPVAGPHSDGQGHVITLSNVTANSFDWSAAGFTLDAVIVKAGSESEITQNVYLYDVNSDGQSATDAASGAGLATAHKQGISHIAFCWDSSEEASPTTTTTAPVQLQGPTTTIAPTTTTTQPAGSVVTPTTAPTTTAPPTTSVPTVVTTAAVVTTDASVEVAPVVIQRNQTAPPAGPTALAPAAAVAPQVLGRQLARTGANVSRLFLFACLCFAIGTVLLVAGRPRTLGDLLGHYEVTRVPDWAAK